MTLKEMEMQVFALIEELDMDNKNLTADPDFAAKRRSVINQVMFEMIRIKKLTRYVETAVEAGDLVDFETIGSLCGNDVYQLEKVSGVKHELKAGGTVIKALETGTLEIDFFVYPERITDKTSDSYEFELSQDVLEIIPYGVAADLLKSDVSANYGKIYAERYEQMKNQLDPRYHLGYISCEGGVLL